MAHYPAVLSYVRRRLDSPDDAADAIAETFMVAWRKLAEVPDSEEALFWLYGVARWTLANLYRGQARRSALAERLRAEFREYSEPAGPRDRDAVREAFDRLSPGDRELLSLAGWEGLRATKIAKVLGCSHGAARIRLHRARKRLARELQSAGLDVASYGVRAVASSETCLRERNEALFAEGDRLLDHPAPAEALERWIHAVVDHAASYSGRAHLLADGRDDEASELHASCVHLTDLSERLIARARESRAIRDDVTGADVFTLMNAAAWTRDESSEEHANRLIRFTLAGFSQP